MHFKKELPFIIFPKDDLATAHKAGALVTACRGEDWEPDPNYDRIYLCKGAVVPAGAGCRVFAKNQEEEQHTRY